jgi:outer membrane protein assembly factor BamA
VPFIANSYRSTFIEGENLTFTFSNSDARRKFGYSYLRLGAEEAGLLISGVRKAVGVASDSFGLQYEQYCKLDFDGRHYFTRRRATIAIRLSGGIGLPYGRSRHLPYIKQYFVGGANSIRGWRVRTLGPGSAAPPTGDEADFIDRTGDIKLESNAEYRFDIAQFFAGAVKIAGATFVDAGNIWLATSEDSDLPGGEFRFNKLGSDLAVSSGLGLRFDFGGFITLRLDVGIPLKVPYDRDGDGEVDGWVFDQFNFGYNKWRDNNLIPQIGIGYPF